MRFMAMRKSNRRKNTPRATEPRRSRSCCILASSQRVSEVSFGVYVHWPFCTAKCPYCDFNSHVRTAIDEDGWVDGILSELDWVAAQQPTRKVVETIFFSGGTS